MLFERRQRPVGVRDQSDLDATPRQLPQDRRHVVVQVKVMTGRPLVVYLAGTRIQRRTGASHLLDDAPCIPDEDFAVVDVLLLRVENDRGGTNGMTEAGRLHG